MKTLIKFWDWYNKLQEPYRFLFAMFVLMLPLHIGAFTNHYVIGASIMMFIILSKIVSEYYKYKYDKGNNI